MKPQEKARYCASEGGDCIEELLSFAQSVADLAVNSDDGLVSAEVLCRKLNKLGIVGTDGASWTFQNASKEVLK